MIHTHKITVSKKVIEYLKKKIQEKRVKQSETIEYLKSKGYGVNR